MKLVGKRSRVLGVVGIGLVACIVAAALVIAHRSSKTYGCADVGMHGPSASTPEKALAAILAHDGGDAAEWRRGDHRTDRPTGSESYDFTPTHRVSRPNLTLITVSNGSGSWRAIGGCVGRTRRAGPN